MRLFIVMRRRVDVVVIRVITIVFRALVLLLMLLMVVVVVIMLLHILGLLVVLLLLMVILLLVLLMVGVRGGGRHLMGALAAAVVLRQGWHDGRWYIGQGRPSIVGGWRWRLDEFAVDALRRPARSCFEHHSRVMTDVWRRIGPALPRPVPVVVRVSSAVLSCIPTVSPILIVQMLLLVVVLVMRMMEKTSVRFDVAPVTARRGVPLVFGAHIHTRYLFWVESSSV